MKVSHLCDRALASNTASGSGDVKHRKQWRPQEARWVLAFRVMCCEVQWYTALLPGLLPRPIPTSAPPGPRKNIRRLPGLRIPPCAKNIEAPQRGLAVLQKSAGVQRHLLGLKISAGVRAASRTSPAGGPAEATAAN